VKILLRLLGLLRPYLPRVVAAWLAILLSTGFIVVTPELVRWAVNFSVGRGKNDFLSLAVVALAIFGAAIGRGAFQYFQTYIGEWLSQHVAFDLREQIYNRLQRLSYAYHDTSQIGQIMSRATQDVEAVRMFISMGVLRLVYVLVLIVATLVLMAVTNLTLALIAMVFVPIVAVLSGTMHTRMRPVWLKVQDGMGILGTLLQENLTGMRVVKSFSREDYESRKFAAAADQLFVDSYRTNQIQALNSPLITAVWALMMVITVVYGGHLVIAGSLSIGALTAFILFEQNMEAAVRTLGFMVNIIARTQSAGERIYEIIDAESAVKEKPDAFDLTDPRGEVTFDHVSFGYNSISAVLRDVNISAQPGEVIALLGPTGSGKSTVVNLLPRFYDVTGGAIRIDGHDIRDLTLASLRRGIGIVQQEVFLFIDTIRENIRYGAGGATDEEVVEAAKIARIHDFIISLPDGYDTWVGERGVTLSGGQKQRISIARMLLMNPRVLVFDDSTSSVDMETEYLIQQALAELMRGRTTFVIAQRLRTVKNADQILVLKNGEIVERGKHDALLANDGLYRQIYDVELRDQEEAFVQLSAGRENEEAVAGD
jgi:ABC-type multidrug transport system fused ATPase/permease subunit